MVVADNFVVATCFSTAEFFDDANNIFSCDVEVHFNKRS